MLANVDREVVGENAGLEIKTAGVSQYKKWQGDEIPDAYYCQCLHYMAVTGADRWYIAVLIGGNDPAYKVVERNEQDIQALISAEREFWGLVQTHTAPPIDGSVSCAQALADRYHGEDKSIVLPDDAAQIIDDLRGDKEILEQLKAQITLRENQLKDMLGEAEVGTVGDYRVTWKTTNPRETCSLSKLKKAAPDIYQTLRDKGFISIGKASRRFAIK
jgi:predicted phage-related endonuclease